MKKFSIGKITTFFLVLLFIVMVVFHSLDLAINVPTFHLDGAFQTASGLFRLDAGQLPGRDFFPYLGIGPLFLIYPFYKLSGSCLTSSVFSAQLVTLTLGWLSLVLLWKLIFRSKKISSALIGAAVIFSLPLLVHNHHIVKYFTFVTEPGNSIRPIRSSIVYIVSILMFYITKHIKNKTYRNLSMGSVIGISLLWSNDFAIVTAAMYSIFSIIFFFHEDKKSFLNNFFITIFAAFLSWSILITIATGAHPIALMKYNFLDVAKDQWWYFGPYGPNTRIFYVTQIQRLIVSHATHHNNIYPFLLLIFYILKSFVQKDKDDILVTFIGLSLFGGGCVATLGGHISEYFDAFCFWSFAVTLLMVLKLIYNYVLPFIIRNNSVAVTSNYILLPVAVVCLLVGTIEKYSKYNKHLSFAQTDTDRFYVAEFKGYLGTGWKDYISFIRSHPNSIVTEEYWGLWSSFNRNFSPWPVDAVIHALGNTRTVAQNSMDKNDFIISTRETLSAQWQHWNLSENFWFYKKLLFGWSPIVLSENTIVWKKNEQERTKDVVKCSILRNNNIKLETENSGLYYVKIEYDSYKNGRYLLFFRNNISYAEDADGYVSLPNKGSVVEFPVFLKRGKNDILDSKITGNDHHDFYIKSCDAYTIPYGNNSIFHIE